VIHQWSEDSFIPQEYLTVPLPMLPANEGAAADIDRMNPLMGAISGGLDKFGLNKRLTKMNHKATLPNLVPDSLGATLMASMSHSVGVENNGNNDGENANGSGNNGNNGLSKPAEFKGIDMKSLSMPKVDAGNIKGFSSLNNTNTLTLNPTPSITPSINLGNNVPTLGNTNMSNTMNSNSAKPTLQKVELPKTELKPMNFQFGAAGPTVPEKTSLLKTDFTKTGMLLLRILRGFRVLLLSIIDKVWIPKELIFEY
jgi:hypothetical protein